MIEFLVMGLLALSVLCLWLLIEGRKNPKFLAWFIPLLLVLITSTYVTYTSILGYPKIATPEEGVYLKHYVDEPNWIYLWIVNAHYYSDYGVKRTVNGEGKMTIGNPKTSLSALTVKVELHRVNPYDILGIWEKKFYYRGQEETFVRFTIDGDGVLIGPFEFEKIKFVSPNGYTSNSNQETPSNVTVNSTFTNMNIEEDFGVGP